MYGTAASGRRHSMLDRPGHRAGRLRSGEAQIPHVTQSGALRGAPSFDGPREGRRAHPHRMILQVSRDLTVVDVPHLAQDPAHRHLDVMAVVIETIRHQRQDFLHGQEDRVPAAVVNEADQGYAPQPFAFRMVPGHHLRIDFRGAAFQDPRVNGAQAVAVAPVIDAVAPPTHHRPETGVDPLPNDRGIELDGGKEYVAIRRRPP